MKGIAALAVLMLFALALTAHTAYMQAEQPVTYSTRNGVFNVTNRYYTLVFDLKHGGRLKAWIDRNTGRNYVGCGDYYPSLTHIFMAENPGVMGHIDNLTVSYPYPLMLSEWNYTVLVKQNNMLLVEFYPVKGNSWVEKQTGGLLTYRIIAFYGDKPYIDVRYIITNPTNKTVTLSEIAGKPGGLVEDISLLAGNSSKALKNWYPMAAYRNDGMISVSAFNISLAGEIHRSVYWLGFLNNATHEFAGMVVLEPELVASYGFKSGYYGRPVLRAYVKYGRISLSPGEPFEISLRIYYGEGNLKWLDEAGFWSLARLISPEEYAKYRELADNPLNATSILKEYAELREEVADLREKNSSLQLQANELKGEYNKCSIQLKDYEDTAKELNDRNASLEVQKYLAFIGGLVAGIILLYLALKIGALKTGIRH